MARGGARYVEQIRNIFGVRSSDARLQRPEFLGGGRSPVRISEVLSTFQAEDSDPQANMAGHGIAVGHNNRFRRFFEEHGWIISVMSVLPRTAYQQGLHRKFSRVDKFDIAWPQFAQIGEQEILRKELFWNAGATSGYKDETFGYQSRYSEYKYINSSVHGSFRTTLPFWHMGRIFDPGSPPVLDAAFVSSNPTNRIFAVPDLVNEQLYCHLYNNVSAVRPLPYFGTPTL